MRFYRLLAARVLSSCAKYLFACDKPARIPVPRRPYGLPHGFMKTFLLKRPGIFAPEGPAQFTVPVAPRMPSALWL
jgi:hypothetical protein